MNAITIHVSDDMQEKVRQIADAEGLSVDFLLSEFTSHMIKQYEARKLFLEMKAQGEGEVEKALELLRR
jgi:predicted transcriptional regulator